MKTNGLIYLILAFSFIGAIFILAYILNFGAQPIAGNTDNWGTFGDYIGGVIGTLFNITGVVLIYLTFKKQQENFTLQQFETTFFNMLANHREIVKSLSGNFWDITEEMGLANDKKTGISFFKFLADELANRFNKYHGLDNKLAQKDLIQQIYDSSYLRHASQFGQYYRNLYHTIKYIDESLIINKQKYMDILQAQMNDDELYCNFYNSLSKYGFEKSQPIMDNYHFFENMDGRTKFFKMHTEFFYPKTKFKYEYINTPLDENN